MIFSNLFSDKYRWVTKKRYYYRTCKICHNKKPATLDFYKFDECGHIVHKKCYKKYKDNKCPRCEKPIYNKKQKSEYMILD